MLFSCEQLRLYSSTRFESKSRFFYYFFHFLLANIHI
nr:MAG TPA: hypothetical protein [Caudoviricetes sp.]